MNCAGGTTCRKLRMPSGYEKGPRNCSDKGTAFTSKDIKKPCMEVSELIGVFCSSLAKQKNTNVSRCFIASFDCYLFQRVINE